MFLEKIQIPVQVSFKSGIWNNNNDPHKDSIIYCYVEHFDEDSPYYDLLSVLNRPKGLVTSALSEKVVDIIEKAKLSKEMEVSGNALLPKNIKDHNKVLALLRELSIHQILNKRGSRSAVLKQIKNGLAKNFMI